MSPKFPNIEVSLYGVNGNAFSLIGHVCKALRHSGVPSNDIDIFMTDSMSGDYDHVLSTINDWVIVT